MLAKKSPLMRVAEIANVARMLEKAGKPCSNPKIVEWYSKAPCARASSHAP